MTAGSDIDVAALQVALEEVSAGGGGLAESSISGALAVKPDQVTLVARTLPDDAAAQRLADRYKSARARLVVVHIDAVEGDPESQAWAQAARATTGRYAALSSARLRRWYEEYLSTRPAPRQ
jgi:nucleotide-binding universal stress UspA family protein